MHEEVASYHLQLSCSCSYPARAGAVREESLHSRMLTGPGHGLIVKDTAFEVLPLQRGTELNRIAPETKVVPPSGGLKTNTSTVQGCAMSVAVIAATNWRLLTNVVTHKEPFQLTIESRRKSFPFTVSRNGPPPATALWGDQLARQRRRIY